MRFLLVTGLALALAAPALAQGKKEQRDEDFEKARPAVGDPLPDVVVYSPDGKDVKTSELRGHHVVLTFGCLT